MAATVRLQVLRIFTGLSAAWIWSRIRRIGRSRYSLFREKLGYLEGGSSILLNALKASQLSAPKIMFECNGSTAYLAGTGLQNYNALLAQAEAECGGDFDLIAGEK